MRVRGDEVEAEEREKLEVLAVTWGVQREYGAAMEVLEDQPVSL